MMQPSVAPVPGEDKVMVLDDYIVRYGNVKIVVPAFFKSDGASIPWYGQRATYSKWHPKVLGPAIVHDWLDYNHQVKFEFAAQILRDLLIANGANKFKSKLIYRAVMFGGRQFWDHKKEDIKFLKELYCFCKDSPNFEEYKFPKLSL